MQETGKRPGGILLAGGPSSRMGKEKGEMLIHGIPMCQYPFRVLQELCGEILVSSCKTVSFPGKFFLVCDEIRGIGPLGGLFSCLKIATSELNLVLPWDMPGVTTQLMRLLLEKEKDYDLLVPALGENSPEPLCGIYRRSVVRTIEEMISDKEYAVHKLMGRVKTKVIRIEEKDPVYRNDLFRNINTPEELEQFRKFTHG